MFLLILYQVTYILMYIVHMFFQMISTILVTTTYKMPLSYQTPAGRLPMAGCRGDLVTWDTKIAVQGGAEL